MKTTLSLIFGLLIGIGIGSYASYKYLSMEMLKGLYLSEANSVTIYLALLKEQEANNQPKLKEYLERYMHSSEIILKGCANDLCKSKQIPEISQALEKLEGHKYQYINP